MTIIEDAVKRLEQARAAKAGGEPKQLGKVVEQPSAEAQAVAGQAGDAATRSAGHETGAANGEARNAVESEQARTEGTAADNGARRVLVEIDRAALRQAGLMPPEEEESRLVDEFRHIKRPIVAHALGKRATKVENGRLIMVASALAGEGKTFTCINLALSMARERDISVVLVDADVAKPHITRMFGLDDQPGLLDVLDDPDAHDYKSLVIETDVPGLGILPAGRPRGNATELLASDGMDALLQAYRRDNIQRLVLFDSPPLLQTPEARVLASLVGQVALVVRAGVTPKHVVLDALGALDESKAINLILNQVRHGGAADYYGGYHGYGYGGREGYGAREAGA